MRFIVIDKKTGKEADEYEIALKEDWAKELMYCDMEGFALLQDGTLILVDECGRFEYCPADRFEIVFEEERPQGEWIDERNDGGGGGCVAICSNCKTLEVTGRFCRTCGSDNTQSFLKSFKCGADMRETEGDVK